jgi:hypothetical protein
VAKYSETATLGWLCRSQTNKQTLNKPPSTKATNSFPVNSVKQEQEERNRKIMWLGPKLEVSSNSLALKEFYLISRKEK